MDNWKGTGSIGLLHSRSFSLEIYLNYYMNVGLPGRLLWRSLNGGGAKRVGSLGQISITFTGGSTLAWDEACQGERDILANLKSVVKFCSKRNKFR